MGRDPTAHRQLVLLAPAHRALHARPRGPARRRLLVHGAGHPLGRAVVAGRARVRGARPHRSARSASECSWRSRARRSRSCRTGSRGASPATACARRSSRSSRTSPRSSCSRSGRWPSGSRWRSWWCGSSRFPTRASRGVRSSRCRSCSGSGRTCTAASRSASCTSVLHVLGRALDGDMPWRGRERDLVAGTFLGLVVSLVNPVRPGTAALPGAAHGSGTGALAGRRVALARLPFAGRHGVRRVAGGADRRARALVAPTDPSRRDRRGAVRAPRPVGRAQHRSRGAVHAADRGPRGRDDAGVPTADTRSRRSHSWSSSR